MYIKEIESELRAKHQSLMQRLKMINADKKRELSGPLDADFEEAAQKSENDEVIDALDNLEREELVAIQNALIRIEKGQYGVCAECGQNIKAERLKAIPYTLVCKDCAH